MTLPGFSASSLVLMALPVDEIAARARQTRPGNAALTAAAIPGVAIGWLIGRILLIIGWISGKVFRVFAFVAETISYGFKTGAGLPTEPAETKEQTEPPKQ